MLFVKVSKREVQDFIEQVERRIIFIKPAFYSWEIEKVLEMYKRKKKITCEIFSEAGDEAIRFGFGDTHGLELILKYQEYLQPQLHDRIRIAILIVDNQTLIYAPSILALDEESKIYDFPNGLTGGIELTQAILEHFPDLPSNAIEALEGSNLLSTIFQPIAIVDKIHEANSKSINQTLNILIKTPPVDPNSLKKINFYRTIDEI